MDSFNSYKSKVKSYEAKLVSGRAGYKSDYHLINSAISSPVSIRQLRRAKLSNYCHIIFLRWMTLVKIASDIFSMTLSLAMLIVRIMTKQNVMIAYSVIYLALSFIDLITCIVLFRRLTVYEAKKQQNPHSITFQIKKDNEFIKWSLVSNLLFYVFITVSFFLNIREFHETVPQGVMELMISFAIIYCLLGLIHFASFLLFKSK